jgi:hypothetical protein
MTQRFIPPLTYVNSDDSNLDPELDRRVAELLRQNLADMPGPSEPRPAGFLSTLPGTTVACLAYMPDSAANPRASDIWPEMRLLEKLPARCTPLPSNIDVNNIVQHINQQTSQDEFRKHKRKKTRDDRTPETSLPSHYSPFGGRLANLTHLPNELLDQILGYLSRDEAKALRLTCKILRLNASDKFFKSIVVPFNANIYDMVSRPALKAKEPQIDYSKTSRPLGEILFKGKSDPDVYSNGMDVFKAFGHRVKKFGMSFEVNERKYSRTLHLRFASI